MNVTPGYLPADNTKVSNAQLRLIASPTVALADGEVTAAKCDISGLSTALQISAGKANYISNPNFSPATWPKGAGAIVAASGSYTELSTGWGVKPSTGRVTQQRSTQVTTVTADSKKSVYSLQILGDTTATGTVEIKTEIPQYLSASLQSTIALTFHIYNGTGSSITPTISWSTPAAADDFTTATQQTTSSCGVCPNAQWTKVTINNIAASAWTNLNLGLRMALILPSACLNNVGKSVYVSQFKLELVAATEYLPEPEPPIVVNENYFSNGNFDVWAYTGTTAASGNALNWTGAMSRSTDHALAGTSYSAKLVGTGSAVDYGQTVTGAETKQNLTFSCWLYNASAAEITPVLRVDLAGGANQFSTSLTPCPVSVWTKLTCVVPAGSYAINEAGIYVYLRLTVTNTHNVYLAQMKLEPGTVATRMRKIVENPVYVPYGFYKNLNINTQGGSASVLVTAEWAVMQSPTGLQMKSATTMGGGPAGNLLYDVISVVTSSAAGGLDYAAPMTSGVWHYVYAIADKNGFTRAILSKSATAPTLPANYIYYLLVGAVMPDSPTNIPAYYQRDNVCTCLRQSGTGGWLGTATGVTADYTFVDVSAYVPPIAKTVQGIAGVTTAASFGFMINTWAMSGTAVAGPGTQIITGASTTSAHGDGVYYGCGRFSVPFGGTSIGWRTSDTTANKRSDITGWTL